MSPTVKQLIAAPFMGALFVVALPVLGLALPIMALVRRVLDGHEKLRAS